jgi:tryptophan synthase beta chain
MACVGGGSNAIGIFSPFLKEKKVRLVGVEAAGKGLSTTQHAASLSKGKPGILHGSLMYLLQDFRGQIGLAHSISAGLDYPGVSPELSYLKDSRRIEIESATDQEALKACQWVSQCEGIIPALETAHAFSVLQKNSIFQKGDIVVLNLSGRGDKDMGTISSHV